MAIHWAMHDVAPERGTYVKGRFGLAHGVDSDDGRYWLDYWAEHPDEKPPE